ncbi:MAG: hypothetical protein ACXQTS_05825 [Candidatus Methanospirareceae archaeon]
MAKNTTAQKEAGKESGDSLPHEEESQVKKEETEKEEEKEKYVIQASKEIEGEDNWITAKKEGKIFVFSSKKNAEESLHRIMRKHPDMLRGRVMRIVRKGETSTLIPEVEIEGTHIIKHSEDILPPEMKEYIDEEMLSLMSEEEIRGIRTLIADLMRKKEEVEKFSRIAVQRSAFLRNGKLVEEMKALQKRYARAKKRLENAKKEWDATKEKTEDFINRVSGDYPELREWLHINITGERQILTPNRGQGRRRTPSGKKGIILRFLKEHRGEHFREIELIEGIEKAGMGGDYVWTQSAVNPRLRSLLAEGVISQDSEGRYYLP